MGIDEYGTEYFVIIYNYNNAIPAICGVVC